MPAGPVTSPSVARALLAGAGLRPSRYRGQNFLVDANILGVIERAASLSKEQTVIEVGAGLGALTERLADRCGHVYAIESDSRLFEILTERMGGVENLELIEADATRFDFEGLLDRGGFARASMVSNLPYRVAALLVVECLISYPWMDRYTVMVQREVAARMTASPGSRDYSSATVKIKSRARVSISAEVSRNCFYPRPLVNSAIVSIERKESLPPVVGPWLDTVVTAAFSQRRKKLANALAAGLELDAAGARKALSSLGKTEARAEDLSPEEFERLAGLLAGPGSDET